jgi:transposase InsO family protein
VWRFDRGDRATSRQTVRRYQRDLPGELTDTYAGFIHFHNHHRVHRALGWATPTSLIQDNLPEEHI